jgi:hypothetical protein
MGTRAGGSREAALGVGVLGALGAIPIAGTLQVFLRDWLEHRKPRGTGSAGDGDRWRRVPPAPARHEPVGG